MEPWVFIILLLVGVPVGVVLWLIVRAVDARGRIELLTSRLQRVEVELRRAQEHAAVATMQTPATAPQPAPEPPPPRLAPMAAPMPSPMSAPSPPAIAAAALRAKSPPPPIFAGGSPVAQPAAPVVPRLPDAPLIHPPKSAVSPAIDWEQFMGVKGFAWVGGFALFLGVVFFIKYAFEKNLIPPALRMGIGFLVGLGLLAGGLFMSRKSRFALAQTLCATGVVVLYAVTYSCHALYHFQFFGAIPTFLLMAVITVAAFLVAVRLEAMVVAILGMLGGFLTPVLISTGQDNPLGLFGYIALLDAGLLLVVLERRWDFLAGLSAAGTALMEIAWANEFFDSGKYFLGSKILVPLAVLLGFNALFFAANWFAQRRARSSWWLAGGQWGLAATALGFTLFFFGYPQLAARPGLIFTFVFLIDLLIATLVWLDEKTAPAQTVAGLAVFGLMAIWTAKSLSRELLDTALAFYLIFGVFHTAVPPWRQWRRGIRAAGPLQWNQCFPPLALALVLLPILNLSELSFLVWPFVLLVDLLALALAAATNALLPVLAVLGLTVAALGILIFKIPVDLTGLPISLLLLGAFSIFFVVGSVWLVRRLKPEAYHAGLGSPGDTLASESLAPLLPGSSAVLPFLLLIMATLRLDLTDPSPVFGVALLLAGLMFALTRLFAWGWMPLVGLASTFAVECAWHFMRFDSGDPHLLAPRLVLGWYLLFYVVFAAFPFVFFKSFSAISAPWAASALAGPVQFLLIYRVVKETWPNLVMGLLPAAFAVPALLGLFVLARKSPATSPARLSQLAWYGGGGLLFITLIFPIQFEREWITIGWALEGAALLWLFHRVPHEGLRLTGLGLLAAAFARLASNPFVLEYYHRGTTPLFNWYLYAYGFVTAALFAGARLLTPPRDRVLQVNARATLDSLGVVLMFLLLNIEIADYFSAPGSTLTFEFSGDFARDMTYSIAWALFALALLIFGIAKKSRPARYTAMGLLGVTLLKLFLHDLAQLAQLYRIGAFVGVASIAMLASFAYQKFFSAPTPKTAELKD